MKNSDPVLHLHRREKRLIADVNVLTQQEVRNLVDQFVEIESPTSCLLLASLSTGLSIEYLLDKNTAFQFSDPVTVGLDGCGFLKIGWQHPSSHLNEYNKEIFDLPTSDGFIVFPKEIAQGLNALRSKKETTESLLSDIDSHLSKASTNTGKRITLKRIQNYILHIYEECGLDDVELCALNTDELKKSHSSASYKKCSQVDLTEKQKAIWRKLTDHRTDLIFTFPSHVSKKAFGSKKVPQLKNVQEMFSELKRQIEDVNNPLTMIANYHNLFTAYTFSLLDLCTAHRPEKDRYGTIWSFDLVEGYVFIDDKSLQDIHYREVPVATIANEQLKEYFQYIQNLYQITFYTHENLRDALERTYRGESDLFFFLSKDSKSVISNSNKIHNEIVNHISKFPPNWVRHYIRTLLNDFDLSSETINAFTGNQGEGDHSFSKYSALSLQELKPISEILDNHVRNDLKVKVIKNPLADRRVND